MGLWGGGGGEDNGSGQTRRRGIHMVQLNLSDCVPKVTGLGVEPLELPRGRPLRTDRSKFLAQAAAIVCLCKKRAGCRDRASLKGPTFSSRITLVFFKKF